MNITRKDATITPTGADADFPGTFEVVLSAQTLDRDEETLLQKDWKTPLPEHITFDTDHGMSVATTVGSGVPTFNSAGDIVVTGSYSSIPRAQEVRTLVNEGHLRTVSVAFMSAPSTEKGAPKGARVRELLNGAFTPVPSNREALILASKGLKLGARNSAKDLEHVQSIHDHAAAMGADCAAPAKSATHVQTKAVVGSLEAAQERARDALNDAYAGPEIWVWLRATLPTALVFEISGDSSDTETYQQDYTDDGSVVTLTGERRAVDVAEVVTPDPDEAAPSGADPAPDTGTQVPVSGARSAPVAAGDSAEMQARAARLRFLGTVTN